MAWKIFERLVWTRLERMDERMKERVWRQEEAKKEKIVIERAWKAMKNLIELQCELGLKQYAEAPPGLLPRELLTELAWAARHLDGEYLEHFENFPDGSSSCGIKLGILLQLIPVEFPEPQPNRQEVESFV